MILVRKVMHMILVRKVKHMIPACRVKYWCIVMLLPMLVFGCHSELSVGTDVAVSIDGERILYTEFEQYLRQNVDAQDLDLGSQTLSRLFDQFLDGQLLVRLAIERGLVEPEVDPRQAIVYLLRDVRRQWSEAEIEAYYHAHRSEYQRQDRVRLRQILVTERIAANEALAALESGEDFAQVAARLSQGPKAHLGGDQGVLGRNDLPPKFIEAIFELSAGQFSKVMRADYGFQIFKVEAHYPASVIPLEAAAPEIRQLLAQRHVDEQVGSFMEEARERYNVEVFPPNFPFEYRGQYFNEHS